MMGSCGWSGDTTDPSPHEANMTRSRCTLATAGLSALCAAFGAACGGSADGSGDQSDAGADTAASAGECPATIALTVGAGCSDEGLLCGPDYTCDLGDVPLLCVCTAGVFACTDATGKSVTTGETPACPPYTAAVCPPDEKSAISASCDDIGLVCDYPSTCGGGTDSCACIGAGSSPTFDCQQAPCAGSDAGIVAADGGSDAGIVAADGGSDAEPEAGRGDATASDSGFSVVDSAADADSGPGVDASLDGGSLPATDASVGDAFVDSQPGTDLDAGGEQ
jgi:hypothetical protein